VKVYEYRVRGARGSEGGDGIEVQGGKVPLLLNSDYNPGVSLSLRLASTHSITLF